MKYSVDCATAGGMKTVVVEADSGDNAAVAAYALVPGAKMSNIQPYSEPPKRELPKGVKAALKAEAALEAEEAA